MMKVQISFWSSAEMSARCGTPRSQLSTTQARTAVLEKLTDVPRS